MRKAVKQSLILSAAIFAAGFIFILFYSSSAVDEICTGFSITGMVTQQGECCNIFSEIVAGSTFWLALWAVICFYLFLIFIEHVLPKLEKRKRKKKRK